VLLALVLPTTMVGFVLLVLVDETVAPGYTFSWLPDEATYDPVLPEAVMVALGKILVCALLCVTGAAVLYVPATSTVPAPETVAGAV
jgi:uracil phosphoribosyltransferase